MVKAALAESGRFPQARQAGAFIAEVAEHFGQHRDQRRALRNGLAAAGHYKPSSVRPGWSAGRAAWLSQWNKRSLCWIGKSLIDAWRTRIRPCSSNSQFSLP